MPRGLKRKYAYAELMGPQGPVESERLILGLVLFGPKGLRFHLMAMEWPEEESRVEGKKRITIDDDEPEDAKDAGAKPAGATAAAPTAE